MLGATNKADGIAYSWHDMPVEFSSPKGNLKNYYSANGTKLKTVVEPAGGGDVSTTHYFTGIEYKDEELHTAYWSDGRANFAAGEPQHEYYLKDHLGNTRVRFADKKDPETGEADGIITYDPSDPENDEVLSTHQYYPFDDRLIIATAIKKVIRNHFLRREPKTLLRVGGWDVPNVDSNGNSLLPTDGETRYTYNGKEMVDDIGLDLHDYGARWYDPAIARWTSVDPLAESYSSYSGYNYVLNNPIGNIDPDGRSVDTEIYNSKGKKVGEDSNGADGNVSIVSDKVGKNLKRGKIDAETAIATGFATTHSVIAKAFGVLSKAEELGGDLEVTAIVQQDGSTIDGEVGPNSGDDDLALGTLPASEGKDNTSIHSHPLNAELKDGMFVSSSTLKPGPSDPGEFSKYSQNVIVGRLGVTTGTAYSDGTAAFKRPALGAAFFDRNSNLQGTITKKAMKRIVKSKSKK